jgi:hypothetical protein
MRIWPLAALMTAGSLLAAFLLGICRLTFTLTFALATHDTHLLS